MISVLAGVVQNKVKNRIYIYTDNLINKKHHKYILLKIIKYLPNYLNMSTQTGIRANDELNQFFAKCRDSESRRRYRLIKVVISNEELSLDLSKEAVGDWKQDWDTLVLRHIENDEPCYLFYR